MTIKTILAHLDKKWFDITLSLAMFNCAIGSYKITNFYFSNQEFEYLYVYGIPFMLAYIGLRSTINILPFNKYTKWLFYMIEIPGLFATIIRPITGVMTSVMTTVLIIFSCVGFLMHFSTLLLKIELTPITEIYLLVTFSSILISVLGEWVYKKSHLISEGSYTIENEEEVKKFGTSVINQDKFIFALYSLFFIFLIIFSCKEFNNTPLFGNNFSSSILRAFATFIAFDRLRLNLHKFKFEFIDILVKYVALIKSRRK